MLESAFAAKRIAAAAGCPWVLDVKDNWELYVPRGLRRVMAWRISGWAAVTANSELTAGMAAKWHAAKASIIYSGVDPDFFRGPGDVDHDSTFTLNLIGGIYFPALLEGFFKGVQLWWERLPRDEKPRVVLRYLGTNVEEVKKAAASLLSGMVLDVPGYLPVGELAQYCKRAAANAYVAHSAGFHHKLLELLACERPTIAFPSEHRESRELAAALGGELLTPETPQAVAEVLTRVYAEWNAHVVPVCNSQVAQNCSWPGQALKLEQVFISAVNGHRVEL
jgi:glycosyltransferase involved in cell wall biosynthesis